MAQLRDLVAIPSASGNLPALDHVREVLVARLEALGARTERVPGRARPHWLYPMARDVGLEPEPEAGAIAPETAVCTRRIEGARTHILLSGHIDTVHDPAGAFRYLEVAADGRRATGPGCADMKGGLLVAIAALEALEDAGERASWTFVLNSDEETGSFHSEAAIRAACAGCDCALVFEPALPDGGLVVERPGSGQFVVEATGRAAHVGRDFAAGVSAVTLLADAITRVATMSAPGEGRIASIGPIEGGTATNAVPDRARAWGNVRFGTPLAMARLAGDLAALEREGDAGDSAGRVRVRTAFNRDGKPATPGVMALAGLARECSEELGRAMPFGVTGGVCDGNITQGAGLATIDTLGVRGGGLHTVQEWVDLDSLVDRAQLAALLIARLGERGVPTGA